MYSKGITWIDDCRIPHNEEIMVAIDYKETKQSENGWNTKNRILEPSNRGRFPANILVSDDMLNDGLPSGNKWKKNYGAIDYKGLNYSSSTAQCQHGGGYTGNNTYADSGSSSRYYNIDKWFENLIK